MTANGADVDVLIVGAGLSGIAAAYFLGRKLPAKTYAILEARDAIGGTWDLLYSASKFAVRGFSQALPAELAGSSVGVTVAHPGGVATSIANDARVPASMSAQQIAHGRARAQRLLRMPPERAGKMIVAALERRRDRSLVGNDAKIVAVLERLLPVSHMKLLAGATMSR